VFTKGAALYDVVYASKKDYAAGADHVRLAIAAAASRPLRSLLDVACGTGGHLEHLRPHYEEVVGLDLDAGMLAVAARRLPGVRLVEADMLAFDLGRQFDAVTCLSSSIAYVRTPENLDSAVARMARHVAPGGVLAVEPFYDLGAFHWDHVSARFGETPTLKVARFTTSGKRGPVAEMTFHWLVGEAGAVSYFTEQHSVGLFTTDQLLRAFRGAGLEPAFDPQGPSGRGLIIGRARPQAGSA
jgi:SAM-dependent methyltransferase